MRESSTLPPDVSCNLCLDPHLLPLPLWLASWREGEQKRTTHKHVLIRYSARCLQQTASAVKINEGVHTLGTLTGSARSRGSIWVCETHLYRTPGTRVHHGEKSRKQAARIFANRDSGKGSGLSSVTGIKRRRQTCEERPGG